jgi:gamma-glutamyl:cysteine ligase YbdK (ATP-grasp superfamily)
MRKFAEKFDFRKECSLHVGIERECFLTNLEGKIVPIAPNVLEHLTDRQRFGYELSACQLEDRIGPCKHGEVMRELIRNETDIKKVERILQFRRAHGEVAHENMPLDVYPDPTGRYQQIVKKMPRHILLAACRVIGTHVHIGMPDHDTALRVYNSVCSERERLCELGDGSRGKRLEIYKIMAPDYLPKHYKSWDDFHEKALRDGFENDPRKCWHLIRISIHGTIEFRMFGATSNLNEIVKWAEECHKLCRLAMQW